MEMVAYRKGDATSYGKRANEKISETEDFNTKKKLLPGSLKSVSCEFWKSTNLTSPLYDDDSAEAKANLIKKGTLGFEVLKCEKIYATYEELKAKGVNSNKLQNWRLLPLKQCAATIPETGFLYSKKNKDEKKP
jgi:hypothetical protein